MSVLPHQPLGASGLEVSAFALGSWRTYERIPREAGVAVLQEARASGIDFLEVARYNDESGTAPIATGYSEVVFGEVFAASGWPRDEVTIATKLWWEFWPQTAAEELEASLERTGLERFDFVYSDPPPPQLPMVDVVSAVAGLVSAGVVRAWGIVNWPAQRVAEAAAVARDLGVAPPCAAQLPYSLIARAWVEGPEMTAALQACGGAKVVASYVLAGGILSGKYASAGARGRMAGELGAPQWEAALRAATELSALAAELGTAPATLAMAFALANRDVATILFGATSPEQIRENVAAAEVAASLSEADLRRLRAIGA
jgi:L-glyceraldehyde 3-phosphate reductase